MLAYAFDRFLPGATTFRDLFDLIVVQARKPEFFSGDQPALEVVETTGSLRPVTGRLEWGRVYFGGNARLVESLLGRPGEDILYVGDHIYTDVHVSKGLLRWRTALVARELERELAALGDFAEKQAELDGLMDEKEHLEHRYSQLRVRLQRLEGNYGPTPTISPAELKRRMQDIRGHLRTLDQRIAPLAKEAGELVNARWGPLLRAGNDKSHLARQIERHADVYTSRVSNLLMQTPFLYARSPRGSLPHDPPPSA
jgi:hypothetical protein